MKRMKRKVVSKVEQNSKKFLQRITAVFVSIQVVIILALFFLFE